MEKTFAFNDRGARVAFPRVLEILPEANENLYSFLTRVDNAISEIPYGHILSIRSNLCDVYDYGFVMNVEYNSSTSQPTGTTILSTIVTRPPGSSVLVYIWSIDLNQKQLYRTQITASSTSASLITRSDLTGKYVRFIYL